MLKSRGRGRINRSGNLSEGNEERLANMCGIVGIWNCGGQAIDASLLEAATDVMKNRGPDDRGTWLGEGIGLGHRRLAVMDLSPAGHQPMHFADRYVIVYNGEIYNFQEIREKLSLGASAQWRSTGDTEVIMAAYHQWGPDCLTQFHGMFALAIWDRLTKTLFLARDRLGVKPLLFHYSSKRIVFASRPEAIMRLVPGLSREFDEAALRIYLEAGYVPAPHSIFQTIRKLKPAHYALVTESGMDVRSYWDFRQIEPELSWNNRHEEDLLDELDEIVTRTTQQRMVSDAPVGAFLSGGIDSSLILAKMATLTSKPPVSLTIGFAEKDFDESGPAEAVARYLGTEHYSQILSVDDLLQLIPTFLSEFDEPCFDYSYFPAMAVSRLAREHVTVALSGDGGDELFGGYHYYQIARDMEHLYKFPVPVRSAIAAAVGKLRGNKFQLLSKALGQSDSVDAFAFARSIAKDYALPIDAGMLHRTQSLAQTFRDTTALFPNGLCAADQAMRIDLSYTLPDDYLYKLDSSSMAFSVECREPLLDQDLVEWAMKLPVRWKLRGFKNKYLLRKLLYRYVPQQLVDRPKMGFGVPMAEWLRGPLREFASERFNSKTLFDHIPIDQKQVQNLYALHCSGKRNVAPLLWGLLALLEKSKATC
jgi:asparagine synthase (glutamine-hydrolysing)